MVLGTLINHPELLSRDTLYELRSIVARYPYFQTARLLMLNNLYLLHDPDFGAELRRSVLYVNDRRTLCRLIEGYADRVMPDAPEMEEDISVDRTMSLIDAFLDTLPEERSESLLVPETVGDYATRFLLEDEKAEALEVSSDDSVLRALHLMSQKEEVEALGAAAESVAEPVVETATAPTATVSSWSVTQEHLQMVEPKEEEMLDESYITETLAKIYIKQRKYSRALEIIRSLYLQFPEKNAYFADQIRFLEKLIINNNLK